MPSARYSCRIGRAELCGFLLARAPCDCSGQSRAGNIWPTAHRRRPCDGAVSHPRLSCDAHRSAFLLHKGKQRRRAAGRQRARGCGTCLKVACASSATWCGSPPGWRSCETGLEVWADRFGPASGSMPKARTTSSGGSRGTNVKMTMSKARAPSREHPAMPMHSIWSCAPFAKQPARPVASEMRAQKLYEHAFGARSSSVPAMLGVAGS